MGRSAPRFARYWIGCRGWRGWLAALGHAQRPLIAQVCSAAFRLFAAVLVLDELFGFWCSRRRMSAFRKIIGSWGSQMILSPPHNPPIYPERKSPTIFLIAATNN